MRIKIKRSCRAVLSLLVTVMLLVGIMPFEDISVNATTGSMTIYFDKDGTDITGRANTRNWRTYTTLYIHIYIL